ncbi:hypothetical protein [Nocardia sp. NBC_01329]|nr:hypothetical protein OG405_01730 [Nocardia sp. NBC_01329]
MVSGERHYALGHAQESMLWVFMVSGREVIDMEASDAAKPQTDEEFLA